MITQQQRSIEQAAADEAYDKLVEALEITWKARIENLAAKACRKYWDDVDAAGYIEDRLLRSPEWQEVAAVDISDIAYRACTEQRN